MFTKINYSPVDAVKEDYMDYIELKKNNNSDDWFRVLIENSIYFRKVGRNCDWIVAYLKAGYELIGTHWAEELMSKEKVTKD